MKTINERLVEARIAAGFDTVSDAVAALGVKYSTYAAHENGTDGFKFEAAIQYARKFKVSLDWLLTGKGRGPSAENNMAWEMYLELADMDLESLEFVRQSIAFAKTKRPA